jgi:hypothetical protein
VATPDREPHSRSTGPVVSPDSREVWWPNDRVVIPGIQRTLVDLPFRFRCSGRIRYRCWQRSAQHSTIITHASSVATATRAPGCGPNAGRLRSSHYSSASDCHGHPGASSIECRQVRGRMLRCACNDTAIQERLPRHVGLYVRRRGLQPARTVCSKLVPVGRGHAPRHRPVALTGLSAPESSNRRGGGVSWGRRTQNRSLSLAP